MKIAVVTGASSGIGREFVYAVDKKYSFDEIWVIARRAERLEELKGKCRNTIRPVALDLAADADLKAYAELLEKEKPEIALLVNAAGCGVFGPFEEKELDALLHSARLNALSLTAMCHLSLPCMKSGSAIINMGSNSSWQPVPYQAVYGARRDQDGVPAAREARRVHPRRRPRVRPRRSCRAGDEGPGKEKDRVDPRRAGAPPGGAGQAPARGHGHGYLVQAAGL